MVLARVSEAARELVAQRPVVKGRCVVCGEPLEGRAGKRYCRKRCAMKASRRRRRERALARSA